MTKRGASLTQTSTGLDARRPHFDPLVPLCLRAKLSGRLRVKIRLHPPAIFRSLRSRPHRRWKLHTSPPTHQLAPSFHDEILRIRASFFSRDPACWPVFGDPVFSEIVEFRRANARARDRVGHYPDGRSPLLEDPRTGPRSARRARPPRTALIPAAALFGGALQELGRPGERGKRHHLTLRSRALRQHGRHPGQRQPRPSRILRDGRGTGSDGHPPDGDPRGLRPGGSHRNLHAGWHFLQSLIRVIY